MFSKNAKGRPEVYFSLFTQRRDKKCNAEPLTFRALDQFKKKRVLPAMVWKSDARDPGMKNDENFETKTIRNQKAN
jgi:hypothetical protein